MKKNRELEAEMQKLREKAEAVLNDRSWTSDDVPKQDDGDKPGKGSDA